MFGVPIPQGYRSWQMAAVSRETEPLNELRGIPGKGVAIQTYKAGTLPFPDGSVLVKMAWKHTQSTEFPNAFVPGAASIVHDVGLTGCAPRWRRGGGGAYPAV